MPDLILAIDLGATKILSGVAGVDGTILGKNRSLTPAGDANQVLNAIISNVADLMRVNGWREKDIKRIAMGVPGPLQFPEGVVLCSPNLGWRQVELKEELSRRWGHSVIVEKDANMAVLGEYGYGSRYQEMVYITVSTGVGAGIITGGELNRGQAGGAGEIGHMVIQAEGPLCNCGRRGCLEALASGNAIKRQMEALGIGQKLEPQELGAAARQGDVKAQALIARLVEYLGCGVTNVVNMLNPAAVILGGGVMLGLKDLLLQPLRDYVCKHAFALNLKDLVIDCTDLGEDIVLYGCIAAVNKKMNAK